MRPVWPKALLDAYEPEEQELEQEPDGGGRREDVRFVWACGSWEGGIVRMPQKNGDEDCDYLCGGGLVGAGAGGV